MNSIEQEWTIFQQQSELLRQKIADAQLLIRAIAASATIDNMHVETPPSDPPNTKWETFPLADFVLMPDLKSIRSVWQEWKYGLDTQPSVEYMQQRYGSLDWVRGAQQRQLVLMRSKVVQEIEFHLEHGRDLEEIFVVGALHLEQLGNNMALFATQIQRNMEAGRATLFEEFEE